MFRLKIKYLNKYETISWCFSHYMVHQTKQIRDSSE